MWFYCVIFKRELSAALMEEKNMEEICETHSGSFSDASARCGETEEYQRLDVQIQAPTFQHNL